MNIQQVEQEEHEFGAQFANYERFAGEMMSAKDREREARYAAEDGAEASTVQLCCGRAMFEHSNDSRGLRCPVICGDADPTRDNLHQHSASCFLTAVQS